MLAGRERTVGPSGVDGLHEFVASEAGHDERAALGVREREGEEPEAQVRRR